MRNIKSISAALAIGFGVLFTAAACSKVPTTSASCAYVIGNGDGNDSKVHQVVLPNSSVKYSDQSENVKYVPCNARNYIINDGSYKNASGAQVGDRFTPTVAYTKTGVQILIWSTSDWTLNQSDQAMRNFYDLCFKYTCASDDDKGGNKNFSTDGWNGMLGENFGTSVDAVARQAAITLDDAIWQKHDPAQYKVLGDAMSNNFSAAIRAKTGYDTDLFCGSGNSGFGTGDASKTFNCTNVRIQVDRVERVQVANGADTQSQTQINADRLSAAKALYGDEAAYWLGLQDTIAACKNAGSPCQINVGTPSQVQQLASSGK